MTAFADLNIGDKRAAITAQELAELDDIIDRLRDLIPLHIADHGAHHPYYEPAVVALWKARTILQKGGDE